MRTLRLLARPLSLVLVWSAAPVLSLGFPLLGAVAGEEPKAGAPKEAPAPAKGGEDVGHMHNVHRITPRLWRGSQPEVEADFAALAERGIKVIVSVDGARPQADLARKHGLRYVHIPMGYNGIARAKEVLLFKVFSTLDGPFYVHCHHGKHRGPAACAVGLVGVEGWTAEQAVAELKLAGTASKYEGLYAIPGAFVKPTAEELAQAPSEFPEAMPVPAFQEAMVEVDQGFARLMDVRKAGWKAPAEHPDVAPRHEATIFAQYLREMARRDEVAKAKPDFQGFLAAGEQAAWDLAKALEAATLDAAAAEAAFQRVEGSCIECHKAYRDNVASKH